MQRYPDRRWVVLLGLLLAAAASGGCGGGAGGVTTAPTGNAALSDSYLFQLGEAAQRRGDPDAALVLYQRLLAEFPASALADDALVDVGDLELAKGNYESARSAYAAASRDYPGGDRAIDARLAWARSFTAEFDSLDSGTPGFVDSGSTGEFLVNLQAQEALRALASDETLELSVRASASLELGDALARSRQLPEARSAFEQAARLSADPVVKSRARIRSGLALLQQGLPELADEAFRSAGATSIASRASEPATAAMAQFGSFSGPPIGSLTLDDLIIVVRQVVETETAAAQLRNAADLGVALNRAFARRDFPGAVTLFEALAQRQLPEPMGDLISFQLAEARRESGDPDGALRDYAAVTRTFAGSLFAQRAHGRIGELLFARFGEEAAGGTRVEGRLVANLLASLRQAVGSAPQPEREARTRALELLGRLEGEGVPQPLVIAQPRGLPAGVVGAEYREQLAAFGASGPLQWTVEPSSPLPDGLSLSAAGVLSGVPRGQGRSFVRLTVRDAAGQTDSRSFLLSVLPFRVLTPPRLFDGVLGKPYSSRLQAVGEGPFTFEAVLVQRLGENGRLVSVGGFVPGLGLAADGLLSGTPSQATGSRPFLLSVRVRDRAGRQGAAFFTLFVVEAGQAAPALEPTISLEAERDAAAPEAKTLFPVRRVSSAGFTLTTLPAHPQQILVTPDGKWAVAISGILNDVLTRVDLGSGEVRQMSLGPRVPGVFPNSLALSPDGRLAAVGMLSTRTATTARLVDLEAMRVLRSVPGGLFLEAVAFTPDGRKLLVRSGDSLTSLELEAGTTSTVSLAAIGRGPCLAVFPDSRRVLVAGKSSSNLAAIVDVEAGTTISFALPGFVSFGEVLRDETTALLLEDFGTRLFVLDLAGGTVESLYVGEGVGNLAVSPDGSRAVVPAPNSGEAAVIDLASRRVRRLRTPLPAGVTSGSIAVSPDGRTAALFDTSPGGDYGLLLDLDTLAGRVVPGFGAAGGSGRHRAVFTPDGRSVLTVRYELTPPGSPGRLLKLELASAPEGVGLVRQPLPVALQGSAYSHRFQARGGSPAYRFELAVPAGTVPGLTLSADGLLSGTPAEPALYALEVSVSDSRSTSAEVLEPLLVKERGDTGAPALFLVTREVADTSPNASYRQSLAALGGKPPYAFRVSEGALPAGLILSPDGLLSGRPVRTSTSTFAVAVTDAEGGLAGRTYVLEVTRPSVFGPPARIDLPLAASDLVALELNGDGRADLAVAHRSPTTNVTLCVSESQNPLRATTSVQVRDVGQPGTNAAGGVDTLRAGDLNGDGRTDLIARSSSGLGTSQPANLRPTLVPLLGTGSGSLTLAPAVRVPALLPKFAAGDLDGDGRDDLVVATSLNVPALGLYPTAFTLRSLGDGTFSEASRVRTTSPFQALLAVQVAEFTGDGRRDLGAIVSSGVGVPLTLRLYAGQPGGTFDMASPSIVAVEQTPSSVPAELGSGDLDGDGRADLVASLSNSDRVAVVFSASPSAAVTMVIGPQGPDAGRPLVVDVDGDGANDLVVPITGSAAQGSEPGFVAVLVNLGHGQFDAPIRLRAGASPHRVVSGDFNGDGKLDLAVSDRLAATVHTFPSVR